MNTNWNPIDTAPTNLPILVGAWAAAGNGQKQWECTTVFWDEKEKEKEWLLTEPGWHAVYEDLPFTPTHWAFIPNPPHP